MPWWCGSCRRGFSVRLGTVMESSHLPLRLWAITIYLHVSSLKGLFSMKLHRDLGIRQATAWHLSHRIREALKVSGVAEELFAGPVEADETYVGGKEGNKHERKRRKAGRGTVGKVAVAGIKDRSTNRVKAQVVERTDKRTLQGFVLDNVQEGAMVYTDEAKAYEGLLHHESVKHSVSEYVNGMAHTNGLESFWALLKRGYHGTYHKMSPKHLARYVNEFATRHNLRDLDTLKQMQHLAAAMVGRRLCYRELTDEERVHLQQ